jgi:hypothetical protein
MAKRSIILLAALLLLGFVAAGCGSDDDSNDNGDTAAQTVTDTDTVTDDEVVTDVETDVETDTDTVTSDDNGGASVRNVEQAVEQCKQGVKSAPHLSADTKSDLQEICEKAGSGDEEDIREAASEVCEKVVDDTIPEGTPGRDQALAACEAQDGGN